MSRRKPKLRRVSFTPTAPVWNFLEQLVATGIWGNRPGQCVERVVCRFLHEALAAGEIKLPPQGKLMREIVQERLLPGTKAILGSTVEISPYCPAKAKRKLLVPRKDARGDLHQRKFPGTPAASTAAHQLFWEWAEEFGVSVETKDELWRIKELKKVPAAVHFLSLEPLTEKGTTIDGETVREYPPLPKGGIRAAGPKQLPTLGRLFSWLF